MVKRIMLHVEGGGDVKRTQSRLREAFDAFLNEAKETARQRRVHWATNVCGGRQQAYDEFMLAIGQEDTGTINLLLVDAEDAVAKAPWQHLRDRTDDNMPGLGEALAGRCHLMAQTMEAWLLADKANLERLGFRVAALPQNPQVEHVPKADLLNGLTAAARNTRDGTYHKTRHGFALLATTDPALVRQAAPHCARLFETLLQCLSE